VPAVTGVVFQDFNANGTRDLTTTGANEGTGTYAAAVDRGLAGIVVTAFDAGGAVRGTATTAADGTYSITISGSQTDPLRVEFTNLPAGFNFGPHGPDSGTGVQFTGSGTASGINTGLVRPADFSTNDPLVVSTQFNFGAFNAGPDETALFGVPYSAGGTTSAGYTTGTNLINIPKSRLGSVYGVAYDPFGRHVYTSAFFKRHSGTGPNGTGAVYRFSYPAGSPAGYNPPAGSLLYADLNAIFGARTAGIDLHDTTDFDTDNISLAALAARDFGGDTTAASAALAAQGINPASAHLGWDAVGKTGLGGMDASEDGQFVFVMNLADRQLYRIPTSGPLNSTTIQRVSVPLTNPDASGTIISAARFRPADLRPFAVNYHNGRVYVGVTYTAETLATGPGDQTARDEMLAAVYELNPATMTFTGGPIHTTRLNYVRSQSSIGFTDPTLPTTWEPWRPTFFTTSTGSRGVAPQAIFSDIAFDASGNMTLGLRDRGTDQIGYFSLSDPNDPSQRMEGFTSGDMLRAFINTPNDFSSGWTLESNARGPGGQGSGPQNNNRGPGGGEFYYEESFNTSHGETSMGALLQVAGFGDVLSTQMDPGDVVRSGGFSWMKNTSGAEVKAYQAYATTNGNAPLDTFGKANGMGGLTLVRELAPVEIGNRLFLDRDADGIQDAGEPGLSGVRVVLFDPLTSTAVGTVTTAADGSYYFSNDTRRTSGGNAFFSDLVLRDRTYQVRIDRTQLGVRGFGVSPQFSDPTANGTARDSNAQATSLALATITGATGGEGVSGHTFDAGFVPGRIGDTVFRDSNGNGVPDGGEGISGVRVWLIADLDGVSVLQTLTATTDANGFYQFSDLRLTNPFGDPITYRVTVDATTLPADVTQSVDPDGVLDNTSTTVLTVAANSDQTRDYGYTPNGSVGDTIFLDANINGTPDAGEGLAGVRVRLSGDLNGNGTVEAGETLTTTTNGSGFYQFTGLRTSGAGVTYTVTVDPTTLPANATQTVDPDGVLDNTSTSTRTTAAPNDPTRDFGYFGTTSLGDRVWYDADGDGVQDANEPGIAGATVTATWFGPNGAFGGGDDSTFTTTTDANGNYLFTGLPANPLAGGVPNYRVQATPPARFPTHTDSLDNAALAPGNPIDVEGSPVSGNPLNDRRDVDFGFRGTAQLGDLVWHDRNANGRQDGGTETGIDGVLVELFFDANNNGTFEPGELATPLLTATTAGGGVYAFTNLAAGNYRVRFANTDGTTTYTRTTADAAAATDATDSDAATATGFTGTYTLANGDNNPTVDAGLYLPTAIGDTVWYDTNGNGTQEANESGLGGVVLVLDSAGPDGTLGTGDDVTGVATATTNAAGVYSFPNLTPGTYRVRVQDASVPFSPLAYTTTGGNTQTSTPASDTPDLLRDFGVRGTGTLGDTIFLDVNASGTPNPGEGLANVRVTLAGDLDGDGTVEANETLTATTNATGFYQFTNLRTTTPGVPYTVTVDATTLPQTGGGTPISNTVDPNGGDDNTSVGTLTTAAPNDPTQDFGYRGPGSIGDTIFLDANANGTPDAGEGASGVRVTLSADVDGNGVTETFTATTNASGNYLFGNLPVRTPAGTLIPYTVTATTADLPAGLANTTDPDGGNNSTSTLTLNPTAPTDLNQDFGYRGGGSVGDRVFLDLNNNGLFDPGEGVSGVTVTLTADVTGDGVQDLTLTATTGADGEYLFAGLPVNTPTATPVSYTVSVTGGLPPGVAQTVDPDGVNDATWTGTLASGPGAPDRRDVDFGYRGTAGLGDRVWLDRNGDGVQDAGEGGIPGAVVELELSGPDGVVGTADDFRFTATTGANGVYTFGGLPVYGANGDPFRVSVRALPATGIAAVSDLDSAVGAGDNTAGGVLAGNQNRTDVDFGYAGVSSISGAVFEDANNDGVRQAAEPGIPGTLLVLDGTDVFGNPVRDPLTGGLLTVTADANGNYAFGNLPPGTYTVSEQQPAGFLDGTDAAGPRGGVVDPDRISQIVLGPGQTAPANNFGELRPASVAGTVYEDRNRNGRQDPTEPGIPGVRVTLTGTDDRGPVSLTLTTDATGSYQFLNLRPGTYTLTQTQPPLFSQGQNTVGTAGGALGSTDVIQSVVLGQGQSAIEYRFGEVVRELAPTPALAVDPVVAPNETSKRLFLSSSSSTPPAATGTFLPDFTALGSVNTTRPVQFAATAEDTGGNRVRVFDLTNGRERFRFTPFPGFAGGVRTAVGDITGDGTPDVVAAAGPGGGPHVVAYDGNTGAVVRSFFAFEEAFRGGSFVATGDFDGDGVADLAVSADRGGGPRVRVFRSADPTQVMADFWGIEDANFRGGARVAAGDLTADGRAELVVAAGVGGGPRVAVYDGRGLAVNSPTKVAGDFFAFEPNFTGGVYLATGDVDGDGHADVITGAGEGGGPRVRTVSGRELAAGRVTTLTDQFAFDAAGNGGGARVAATDLDGDGRAELFVGTGPGVAPLGRFLNPRTGLPLSTFTPDLENRSGGVFVG
jgi:protocatechuate 3,4-dioxygenase beta subunit